MFVTEDIKYIGVNDHDIDLFEGMYAVPSGISYNSYVIVDEKIAVMDSVEERFAEHWFYNLEKELKMRHPDFLVVQHMEPDHSANILNFMNKYPKAMIVATAPAFGMMKNFFGTDFAERRIVVTDGDMLSLGRHQLRFLTAPMVHWPEVMVTYDQTEQTLFSADGFGKFGTLDKEDEWTAEARRYYFCIIGKYGLQVQSLLKKINGLDIKRICPLHGPVLTEKIENYISFYDTWSGYRAEEGVLIVHASFYGNTRKAALLLAEKLWEKGAQTVVVRDVIRDDMSEIVTDAFRYSKVVFAATTYNGEVFPAMREFLNFLTDRNFGNRKVAFIENGSWAPNATRVMKEKLSKSKDLIFADTNVKILSALKEESISQLELLADELCK